MHKNGRHHAHNLCNKKCCTGIKGCISVMMKILRNFFYFSCGEICEAVYEAEKQTNVVIIKNSLSDRDIKFSLFFGTNLLWKSIMLKKC
jgi:hypothetical protein